MKPAIGSMWRHIDPSECTTVWRIHSHSPPGLEWYLTSDMEMTLLYVSGSGQNSLPVGATTYYWSDTMMDPEESWTPIDEEDLPLILLGAL